MQRWEKMQKKMPTKLLVLAKTRKTQGEQKRNREQSSCESWHRLLIHHDQVRSEVRSLLGVADCVKEF